MLGLECSSYRYNIIRDDDQIYVQGQVYRVDKRNPADIVIFMLNQ